ncbi:glutathione S-transferase family protein [Mesorhizobium australicum]|uniref:Glutathione S-transferase n=1 Tax=Mesorhizobium australicum TaxID=536018 RepID=A0A1X7PCL5_9HYPH|nr:glutathione S-transferase [Mesorhizobium australicum]SMH48010.1 glutathione S-transferase [Mesorhizobium australicum]
MLKFYHAPWSRSSGTLWLLEELGVDYQMEMIDIRAEGGVSESYRAVQPNKKVPAIVHRGIVITERAAIAIYLADMFLEVGLAPAVGDPARGPYLTMTVYCDSVLDPAISAHAQDFRYTSNQFSFGLFDDMVNYLERVLSERRYAAGDSFTAADTQLGSAIGYTMNMMNVLPRRPVFEDYMSRIVDRPAYKRAQAKDMEMARTVPFFAKEFAKG